tara:strand:+ start:290 stop:601 length:312 start_codon:yes stop_codon:yes gene_type:complete
MFKKIIFFIFLFLNACATPHVVSVIGPNDNLLSCKKLETEISTASKYARDAKAERNWGSSTNIASLLFWFPGLVATQINADEAINAANERIEHLTKLISKKNC